MVVNIYFLPLRTTDGVVQTPRFDPVMMERQSQPLLPGQAKPQALPQVPPMSSMLVNFGTSNTGQQVSNEYPSDQHQQNVQQEVSVLTRSRSIDLWGSVILASRKKVLVIHEDEQMSERKYLCSLLTALCLT